MNGKVVIIILNYINYGDTIDCLRSLTEITYPNRETIVVDSDSQNESLEHIHKSLSDWQVPHVVITESAIGNSNTIAVKTILLQSSSNRGYAAGNNLGIRVALARGADYVLILNNDTLVDKGFLEPLIQYVEAHEKVGAVGPMVVDLEGNVERSCARRRITPLFYFFVAGMGRRLFHNNYWMRKHTYKGEYFFDHPKEVDVLSGCCFMLKTSVLNSIGLLDEHTFLYYEEFILHEKLRMAGLNSAVVPSSKIIHKYGQSTAKAPSEHLQNALKASMKYYLIHCRGYRKSTAAVLMISASSPKEALRRLWLANC